MFVDSGSDLNLRSFPSSSVGSVSHFVMQRVLLLGYCCPNFVSSSGSGPAGPAGSAYWLPLALALALEVSCETLDLDLDFLSLLRFCYLPDC